MSHSVRIGAGLPYYGCGRVWLLPCAPLPCADAGARCRTVPMDKQHNLMIASLARHPASGSFHCPLCDTPFARRSNLKRHYAVRACPLVICSTVSHVAVPQISAASASSAATAVAHSFEKTNYAPTSCGTTGQDVPLLGHLHLLRHLRLSLQISLP
jgi:hypothetical protein